MPSYESKLFLWGGLAVCASGLLWFFPGLNALLSVAAIAGLTLVVTRLGYFRAIFVSILGLILVTLESSVFLGPLFGVMNGAIFAAAVISPGIAMGAASRNFASPIKTVWYGFIPILVLFALILVFYGSVVNNIPSLLRQVNAAMVMNIDNNPLLAKTLFGSDTGAREKFLDEFDKSIVFFIKIMPGTIVVGYLTIVILSLILAGNIGSRIGVMLPRFRPFYLWRASDWWLLPTAAGLALVIFGPNELWQYTGGNILVVTGNIYAVAGMAVTESFFRRLAIPNFMRIVFYVIMLLLFVAGLVFLAALGLADSRFNFNRDVLDRDDKNIE